MKKHERMFWLGVAYGLLEGGWCDDDDLVLQRNLPKLHKEIDKQITERKIPTDGSY